MSEVVLTFSELLLGSSAGCMRQVENIKLNRKDAYGAGTHNDWQLNIEGVLAEMALSKYLGVYWKGKGEFRETDVADVDVRSTGHQAGCLILHPEDPDERKFYLLVGSCGKYRVAGSIMGHEGKSEEFWSDPSGKGRWAYFVPQSRLRQT